MQARAARAGLQIDVGLLTPREIMNAFEAARQRARDADFLAWLIGRYVALAVHAPGRYPGRPNAVREIMEPQDMKRCFAALSERGKAHGDGGDAAGTL